MKIKDLILFIRKRAKQVENDDRDSIEFKNGYYLAKEEILEFIRSDDFCVEDVA